MARVKNVDKRLRGIPLSSGRTLGFGEEADGVNVEDEVEAAWIESGSLLVTDGTSDPPVPTVIVTSIEGVAEGWDAEHYFPPKILVRDEGILYVSKQGNVNKKPAANPEDWLEIDSGVEGGIGIPLSQKGAARGVAETDVENHLAPKHLAPSVANSSSATISPLTHGAKVDGVTDDAAAFQAAVTESVERGGVPIVIPDGTMVIKSPIVIPKNLAFQVPIRGAGKLNTTVKLVGCLTFLRFPAAASMDIVGNVDLQDFCVDGNNEASTGEEVPVFVGTYGAAGNTQRVDILNVTGHRLRAINVPALDAPEGGRRHFVFSSNHPTPGLPMNRIEHIDLRQLELEGAQCGVYAGSFAQNHPSNVRMRHIHIEDLDHSIPTPAEASEGFMAHVQIGQAAWTDEPQTIIVRNVTGANSGDVGVEMDIPGLVDGLSVKDPNNAGLLFTTFNPTVAEPIVTTLTAEAKVGDTTLAVADSSEFEVGEQVVVWGKTNTVNVLECDVRVVKAKPSGSSIELTEPLGIKHPSGACVQQVGDMTKWLQRGQNIKVTQDRIEPGASTGLLVQNIENPLPIGTIDVDGLDIANTEAGVPAIGSTIKAQTGTTTSPTGSPLLLRIRRLAARYTAVSYSGTGAAIVNPVFLSMKGPKGIVEISGQLSLTGPGATSTGKLPGRLVKLIGKARIDLDLVTSFVIGNTGGEGWRVLSLNEEGAVGDVSGRYRHRAQASSITTGGGSLIALRIGKGCGFASGSIATKTTGAELAIGTTVIPTEATPPQIKPGAAFVLDALSAAKAEILVAVATTANSITVVGVGNTPGTTIAHAPGATVALLGQLVVEDCEWHGLGSPGIGLSLEDAKLAMRLLTNGNSYAVPQLPEALAVPESEKTAQVLQAGRSGTISVEEGAVTAIEWSADGKTWVVLGSYTGTSFPVSTGDFWRLTYSVAPTVKFHPARV